MPCGVPGNPCCGSNTCENGGCCVYTKCIAAGTSCTAPGGMVLPGTCSAGGSCGSCGGLSQPCCELPGPVWEKLKETRISGKLIELARDQGPPPNKGPRKPRD